MQFRGVLPPLPTPFDETGQLDLGLLSALVARLNREALPGYVALGSNGEAPHVSADEAEKIFETIRRAAPPERLVIAGTGRLSSRETVELSRRAAGAGASAVLVVTPYFYKGSMNDEALLRHFETVAGSSPVPVILYNVPANTGLNVPPSLVAQIGAHPNVQGVKDSSGDIGQLAELVRLRPSGKDFSILSGNFGSAFPGYAIGADGAILAAANIAPAECVAIRERFLSGGIEEARSLHLKVLPAARAVTSQWGVPGLKAALAMQGLDSGIPRLPLLPLGPEKRAGLRRILEDAGLLGT